MTESKTPTKRKAPAKPRRPIAKPEEAVIPGEVVEDPPLGLIVAYRKVGDPRVVVIGEEPVILIGFNQNQNQIEVDAAGFTKDSLQKILAVISESIPTLTDNTTQEN